MKYFYITVITQYDGYEWLERAVTTARNETVALKRANKHDWTHDNGTEIQEVMPVREISKEDYEVLKKYLFNL